MSISPQNGASGFERSPCLKYYNILKLENGLSLEHNAAKNTDYMKKRLK